MSLSSCERLVVLGAGFLGTWAAKLARDAGLPVVGTTRSQQRAASLEALGVDVRCTSTLDARVLGSLDLQGSRVLVTFPPDEETDDAVTRALSSSGPRSVVYISSTGVYGDSKGHIDEGTPTDPREPRQKARLAAEEKYRSRGATILRSAAIYGPGKGLHIRLARHGHSVAEGGTNVVSRIHVEDLARLALAALEKNPKGEVFCVADDAPVPQIEVIDWLCSALHLAPPTHVPRETLPETLRHDRSIDGRKIQRVLGISLLYPTYREGFTACVEAQARGEVWP
jgi:nucleoside-diphosphate-sugar epimerase